jgi:hypothetical protein
MATKDTKAAPTDEQVEASAEALCALDNVGRNWPDDFYDYQQEEYRVKARAALNAQAPVASGRAR